MVERGSEQRTAEGERKRERSLGRRIATGIFWVLTLYMAAVGFYSIIPQVFAPQAAAWADEAVPDGCGEGLGDLKSELLARASARVAAGGIDDDGRSLERWLRSWDERYLALGSRCEGEAESAHEALGQLRDRTGTALQRFDDEQAALAHRIDRAIETTLPEEEDDKSFR